MLTKTPVPVLVDPGHPGVPGQPERDFVMFAPAPPKGYTYNAAGAPANTNQLAHSNWNPVKAAPAVATPTDPFPLDTKDYASLSEISAWLAAHHIGGFSPSGYTMVPVVDSMTQAVLGYSRSPTYKPSVASGWYGPIPNMEFVTFPDVACDPNGHPKSGTGVTKARGYFDYNGTRYWGLYRDGGGGVWYLDKSDARPDGAVHKYPGILGCPPADAVPPVPAVPPTYRVDVNAGWNAGARSSASHSDDMRVVFNGATAVMEVVGLYEAPNDVHDVTDYTAIDYGLLLTPSSYQVIERGKVLPIRGGRDEFTQFTIERMGNVVGYRVGGTLFYQSNRLSFGAMRVGATLYAAPDGVP